MSSRQLRAVLSRFLNWLFREHTHCQACGEELHESERSLGVCQRCWAW
jgi:hypothetical protein